MWRKEDEDQLLAVWEMVKWVVWVDLEGFSCLHSRGEDTKGLLALRGLMGDLFHLGNRVYPAEGERLFIHQVGDGFVVKPDFGDIDLLRPISVGVALLRASLLRGSCLKVGIGLGDLADVQGCYPQEIQASQEDGCVCIGAGLMTMFPVMGDGLVDSHAVSQKASGPLLITRGDLIDVLPKAAIPIAEYRDHFEVDWVHANLEEADQILTTLGLSCDAHQLEELLRSYLKLNTALRDNWRKAAQLLIRGY